jgi:GT2 family glycosyltransferase
MIKSSVIVITYNGRHHLEVCFRSLEKQSVQAHETILIDNGSQDGSADFVRRNFPWVRVIESDTNLGFAGGNNLAAREASGDVLVFLNDDTEVDPDWLEKLLSPFDSDPRIAIVGCKMIDFFDRNVEVRVVCDLFGSAMNYGAPRTPLSHGYEDVFYVPGFALAIRRTVFDEVGRFDDSYFMFAEDIDLDWRVLLAGHRMVAVRNAAVYHKFGGSVPGAQIVVAEARRFRTALWKRELGEKNLITTLLKNYSTWNLAWVLPSYFGIYLLELLFFVIKRRPDVVRAYGRALISNVRDLKRTLRVRQRIQAMRQVPDRMIIRQVRMGSVKVLQAQKTGFHIDISS